MRIGVDACCFANYQSGIGRYTYQLCKQLASQNHELICYLPSTHHSSFLKLKSVNYREGSFEGLVKKILWQKRVLSSQILQDNLDVFWGPSHRLPQTISNKIPSVITIHDLIWEKHPETMQATTWLAEKLFMKKSICTAGIVTTVSKSTANDLVKNYHLNHELIDIIPPGVTKFPPHKTRSTLRQLGIKTPYILSIGTIEPRKNYQRHLQAYANLNPSIRDKAHLVIVGRKGWGCVDINKYVEQNNLKRHVHYLPSVDDDTLAPLYQNCLFLSLPSLYEGFGMPLIEAMSFGKAVLTSNISAMPEVAQKAGLLVDPTCVQSISNGLNQLISKPQLRQQLAQNASSISSQFSWECASTSLLNSFSKAIKSKQMVTQ